MKTKIVSVTALALLMSACATSPNKIPAQYVSPMQYSSYDCDQIMLEQAAVERRTNELYGSLKKQADGDKWQMGVGMLLFWPALFALEGGDGPEATEYARLRGEYEALRVNSVDKKCDIQFKDDLKESLPTDAKEAEAK